MNHRYTRTAIFLHWLVAPGLIGTFSLGFYMHDLPLSPNKLKLYAWHKWAGVSLLVLIVVRLAWRMSHKAPEFPLAMKPMARLAAHRSEERRVGKECVSTGRSRWSPSH